MMAGRRIGVACLIWTLVVFQCGCTDLGTPSLPSSQEDSDAGNVSSQPPSDDSGQPSGDSDAGSPSGNDTTPAVTRGVEPSDTAAFSFEGCWDSPEWGWMQLESDGVTVTGVYEHDDGRIAGLVQGATASGSWSEDPGYAPPDDAGQFEFTLAEDGQSFEGNWSYGYEAGWDGSWTAVRVECEPSEPSESPEPTEPAETVLAWSTIWDTTFGTMELEFSGETVTGRYDHDEGHIDGVLSGRVITGTWSEAPSYAPPNDAGQFEFTLSEDGLSFIGRWRYGSDGGWSSWSGTAVV